MGQSVEAGSEGEGRDHVDPQQMQMLHDKARHPLSAYYGSAMEAGSEFGAGAAATAMLQPSGTEEKRG